MTKILHINAAIRAKESRTLKIAEAYLEALSQKNADLEIDRLDLEAGSLPEFTVMNVRGKYVLLNGGELQGDEAEQWKPVEDQINRFLAADAYLITSPMWNFSVPYKLKHYIDMIAQPGYLYKYSSGGPEGLVKDKPMTIITTRGGDYSAMPQMDFLTPYLKSIFGLCGFSDFKVIDAQPMDSGGDEKKAQTLEAAIVQARELA